MTFAGIAVTLGVAVGFGLAFVWIYQQGLIWSSGGRIATVEFYANCPPESNLGWLNPKEGAGIDASIPAGRTTPVAVVPVTPVFSEDNIEEIVMDLNGNQRTGDLIEFVALNESGDLLGARKSDTAEAPMPNGAPSYADADDLDDWEDDLAEWLTRSLHGIFVDAGRGCWGVRGEG